MYVYGISEGESHMVSGSILHRRSCSNFEFQFSVPHDRLQCAIRTRNHGAPVTRFMIGLSISFDLIRCADVLLISRCIGMQWMCVHRSRYCAHTRYTLWWHGTVWYRPGQASVRVVWFCGWCAQVWLVGSDSHVPGCEGTLNAQSAFSLMSDWM